MQPQSQDMVRRPVGLLDASSPARSYDAPSARSPARRGIAALAVVLCGFAAAGCSDSGDSPVAPFAGSWTGQMSFSDGAGPQSVEVSIPDDCTPGDPCGETDNPSVSCTWEMTLDKVDGKVLSYTFSSVKSATDKDLCDTGVGTSGTLTEQSDGTLLREHTLPTFTASGPLTKKR